MNGKKELSPSALIAIQALIILSDTPPRNKEKRKRGGARRGSGHKPLQKDLKFAHRKAHRATRRTLSLPMGLVDQLRKKAAEEQKTVEELLTTWLASS